jgi:autotransporter-associated beta strand protein
LSISSQLILQAAQMWSNSSANSLSVSGNIINDTSLTLAGPGNFVISGDMSGAGGLAVSNSARLTLESATAISGTISVTGGTLDLAQGNALQLGTLIAPSPGSLMFDQAVTSRLFNVGALSGTGNIALVNSSGTAGVTLSVGAADLSTTYAGVLSGSGGLAVVGFGTLTLAKTGSFSGGTTIGGGTLQLGTGASGQDGMLPGGGIVDNGTLAYNLYGNQTFSGALSGIGTLLKAGSTSILTLAASNTFSGTTTVSSGTLDLANSASLQFSTLVAPTTGGDLVFDKSVSANAFVLGNLSGSGNLALQNNASTPVSISLTVGGNNSTTFYGGVLSGSGSLTMIGNGALTLINTNTFTGGTTITNGAIQLGDGTIGHDGSLPAAGGITNNAALVYNLYGSQTFAGVISGSGSLTTIGTGTLTLTGTSPFSGGTTISAGTLQLGTGVAGHDGMLSGTGGIVNNSVMVANYAGPQTLATPIGGIGILVKAGTGTLTLTQPNSYSGGTTISAGTLQLGNGTSGNDGSLAGVGGVIDNGTLAVNLFGSQNYADNISGSGSLLKTGTGSLLLAGSNTYSGVTTVSGGILEVTATSALPGFASGSLVKVSSGGTLVLSMGSGAWTGGNLTSLLTANGSGFSAGSMLGVDTTSSGTSGVLYTSAISGSMGLTKFGANTLTLTASNTYSGGTVISGGALQLGNDTSGNDGSVPASGGIANNGVLVYDLFAAQTYSGAISGVGNLVKAGSTSILTLAGSNTFSGVTTISAGTLDLASSAALLRSTLIAPPPGSLVFDHSVSFRRHTAHRRGHLARQLRHRHADADRRGFQRQRQSDRGRRRDTGSQRLVELRGDLFRRPGHGERPGHPGGRARERPHGKRQRVGDIWQRPKPHQQHPGSLGGAGNQRDEQRRGLSNSHGHGCSLPPCHGRLFRIESLNIDGHVNPEPQRLESAYRQQVGLCHQVWQWLHHDYRLDPHAGQRRDDFKRCHTGRQRQRRSEPLRQYYQ